MSSLTGICEAIAANLEAIPNVQVSAYVLSNPTPPTLDVWPEEVEWDKAMGRGLDERMITVRATVGLTSDVGSAQRLYRFLDGSGPESVKQAIEADPSLGGLVDDVHVTKTSPPREFPRAGGGGTALGALWTVRVLAPGTT